MSFMRVCSCLTPGGVVVQLKKVLSSIPETMLNVECLMNDVDVSSKMTRELFEQKSASILERVKLPLQQVKLPSCCLAGKGMGESS